MSRFVTGRSIRPGQDLSQGIANTGATATGAIVATGAVASNNNLVPKSYVDTLAAALAPPGNTNVFAVNGTCGADAVTGQFCVPPGVNNIFVQIWGGGGGGAMNCTWKVGAPGGGGGYTHKSIAVTPGQCFCYCAPGGGCGGSYPNSKNGCKGCDAVFWGPIGSAAHCLIACGGCGGFCNGTTYGQRACGGCSTGGDLCIQGGDGHQTSCCSCAVNKCRNTQCYTPQIFAGGSFLGAPSRFLHVCQGLCCPGATLGARGCGLPFGGGGFGGISGFYSGGCACGSNGGGGAVMIWF
jgi:hypothetical protein